MNIVGLFAGIGGIEYGFYGCGHNPSLLCEIMPEAESVLKDRFQDTNIFHDVCKMEVIPDKTDILTAGFPCQNISIAGDKQGINGDKSSLLHEIFRLIENSPQKPRYIIIENVANIISLHKGEAITLIIDKMMEYGYNWAYRLIDPRSFGIPQRRPRFVFIASKEVHPKYILFPKDEDWGIEIEEKPDVANLSDAYGFYWTEGKIGIGWANNSIPPLKCGSTLGLPSSPAIWNVKDNFFGTPVLEDAERLQGFPANWTCAVGKEGFKKNLRWKLIGNAVNTSVSNWISRRMENIETYDIPKERILKHSRSKWNKAGFNDGNKIYGIKASKYPCGINYTPILNFMENPLIPLSLRATIGFRKRVLSSTLIKYPQVFIDSLNSYLLKQYDYDRKD